MSDSHDGEFETKMKFTSIFDIKESDEEFGKRSKRLEVSSVFRAETQLENYSSAALKIAEAMLDLDLFNFPYEVAEFSIYVLNRLGMDSRLRSFDACDEEFYKAATLAADSHWNKMHRTKEFVKNHMDSIESEQGGKTESNS